MGENEPVIAHIGFPSISYSGGLQTYARELLPELGKKGYGTLIYTPKNANNLSVEGIEPIGVPHIIDGRFKAHTEGLYSTLNALFKGVDLIHYHCAASALSSVLPTIIRKPVVVTLHGANFEMGGPESFKAKAHAAVKHNNLRFFADEVVSVREKLSGWLKKSYGIDSPVIYHGAKLRDTPEPEIIKKLGLEGQDYIFHVGRLSPEKGADLLIKAHNQLDSGKKLVIAGGQQTNHEDFYEHLRDLAGDDVIFTGVTEGKLLDELFANAAVFVSPMKKAGIPLTMIEAMSYGTPVIASDIDVKDTRFSTEHHPLFDEAELFASEDIGSLCDAIENVIQSPSKAAELGIQGREFVKNNMSWEKTAGEYDLLYKRILDKAVPAASFQPT